MIRTFDQTVKFLEKYIPTPKKRYPGELGIRRMRYLMDILRNPQLKYPTIHVGGTSGKGSTATIIASILTTRYKVGLHTSPHLVKITERIQIYGPTKEISSIPNFSDTRPLPNLNSFGSISSALQKQSLIGRSRSLKLASSDISDKDFIDLVNFIQPFVRKVEKSSLGAPSFFEIISAIALWFFYQQKVDIAVIEVGMGGRYDATNVINPLVAVLTNVSLDHMEILGDTVEKIAKDKVGIIKSGIQVVSGVRPSSVKKIIKEKCKKEKAKLSLLNKDFSYQVKNMTEKGSVFDYFGKKIYRDLELSLLGEHQVENASIAIRAIEELNNLTMKQFNNEIIGEREIRLGLGQAYIPGRLEVVKKHPLVIMDGAHNPDKIKALVNSIKKIFPKKKVTVIIAIKTDKNAKEMLGYLLKISQKVIFTKFELTGDLGTVSSYSPDRLLNIAYSLNRQHRYTSRHTEVVKAMKVITDVKKALGEVMRSAKIDDLILITGSLYLVGEVKRNFK